MGGYAANGQETIKRSFRFEGSDAHCRGKRLRRRRINRNKAKPNTVESSRSQQARNAPFVRNP